MKYSESTILALRSSIENDKEISPKRKDHILAVERMVSRLAAMYLPESEDKLRVAALLHDLTKEYTAQRHIAICRAHSYEPSREELDSPKVFHAMTAAMLIPELYPEFDDPEVISAVRWHTTGRAGMTLAEKLVYLADYIDDTRKFEDCVKLREAFFEKCPEKMSEQERLCHLDDIMILSYRMTVSALVEEGKPININTVQSFNELLCNKIERK